MSHAKASRAILRMDIGFPTRLHSVSTFLGLTKSSNSGSYGLHTYHVAQRVLWSGRVRSRVFKFSRRINPKTARTESCRLFLLQCCRLNSDISTVAATAAATTTATTTTTTTGNRNHDHNSHKNKSKTENNDDNNNKRKNNNTIRTINTVTRRTVRKK